MLDVRCWRILEGLKYPSINPGKAKVVEEEDRISILQQSVPPRNIVHVRAEIIAQCARKSSGGTPPYKRYEIIQPTV
jgi:hypothetical protein